MDPLLQVDTVNTFYGESHVLQGVSLTVGHGEAVALLGRNGAGKTTTINSIAGLVRPRSGSIVFDGTPIHHMPPHLIARSGMGLVPQGRRLFPDLTVEENLTLAARSGEWDLKGVYGLFPRLEERKEHGANKLSGGEQQMVALGRALMTNPRLLLLDEPSEGLAPMVVRHIGDIVCELKTRGLSILLVEQHFPLAMRIADRAYVIAKGRVVFDGPAQELIEDEQLKHQHLGV